jgi:hypothetical protein
MTSPKGFLPWTPSTKPNRRKVKVGDNMIEVTAPSNAILLPQVLAVIEAARPYWPLTQRTYLYRLVARFAWPKLWEDFLNTILDRGRRAEIIPREAIASGRGFWQDPQTFSGAANIVFNARYLAATAQLDRQLGQDRQLALWVETEGMAPLVSAVAHEFSMPLLSGGGFDSITNKMKFADLVASAVRPLTILHIGDLDHSGDTIWRSLVEDLTAMARHLGGELEIQRIACLDRHIDELGLPYADVDPGRADDGSNHGAQFAGTRGCQAEAIDPPDLLRIIRDAIEPRTDRGVWDEVLRDEHAARIAALKALGVRNGEAFIEQVKAAL